MKALVGAFNKEYINAMSQLRTLVLVLTWAMLCWVPGSAELSSSPDMVLAVSWVSRQRLEGSRSDSALHSTEAEDTVDSIYTI